MRVVVDRSTRSFLYTAAWALALGGGTASNALATAAGTDRPLPIADVKSLATLHSVAAEAVPTAEGGLKRAEQAVTQGDLRTAERQLKGVAGFELTTAQKGRVEQITKQIVTQRQAIASQVPALLQQAEKAMAAGKIEVAQATIAKISQSGVSLPAADAAYVSAFELAVADAMVAKASGQTAVAGVRGALAGGRVNLALADEGDKPAAAKPEEKKDEKKDETKVVVPAGLPASGQEVVPGIRITPLPGVAVQGQPVTGQAEMPQLPGMAPDPYFPGEMTPMVPAAPVAPSTQLFTPTPVPMQVEVAQPMVVSQPVATDNLLLLALQAEAQRLIAEGDQAFGEGRYAEAARKYEQALSQRSYLSGDETAHAEKRLAEARVRLGSPSAGSLDDVVTKNFALVREKTTVEFENHIAEARRALQAGDAERAQNAAASAQLSLDRARTYFSQGEYDAMSARVSDLKREVSTTADQIRTTEQAKREAEAKARSEQVQKDLESERSAKIEGYINRIRQLQRDQKYVEALEVCEQVLFLDPTNPSGLLLKDILQDIITFRASGKANRQRAIGLQQEYVDNLEAMVPPGDLVTYPNDWPQITMLRTGAGGFFESPENRRAMSMMDKSIPASFDGVALDRALAYIGKTSGVDIDVDWKSLEKIGVERDMPVSLSLSNASAKVVLERVLRKVSKDRFVRADYAVDNGSVMVGSADVIRQTTVTQTYQVTDMLLASPDYVDVPDFDLAKVYDAKQNPSILSKVDPFSSEARATAVPEKKERVRQLVSAIQQNIDPDSWRDNGGDIGSINEMKDVLIITTTPKNHREITGLLSKLREIRQTQINVETRFLLVNSDFYEEIAFDFDITLNPNAPRANEPIFTDPTDPNLAVPPRAPGGFSQVGFNQGSTVGNLDRANGGAPILQTLVPANNSFVSQLLENTAPALGVGGTFLDDIGVSFLLRATQADRRTMTMTAPRLTFTNGQISNVVVGTQTAFVSDLTPVTGSGAAAFDPEPETLATGVSLLVEGVASADRRYVTLNVETGISQLLELVPFIVNGAVGGGDGGDGSTFTGQLQLPTQSVSRVQTTVTVPDQGTILMGGQRLTTEVEIETGVPILSKIPIINRFFTNRLSTRQDQTLLILMKPTVLIQSEREEQAFPGLLDSIRGGN
jgi:type II secretory pathway component GspD/PulD (secretin)/tetratricopeptide (TPR) repeat protein